MKPLNLYVVDAFTQQPFAGNPAGVCLLDQPSPEAWMKALAAEMKHSETAFLLPEKDGYRLRWFTPATEVDLCGHATLASSHILFETGRVGQDVSVSFYTRSGELTARCQGDWLELNFPAEFVTEAEPPAGMLEALGVQDPRFVGRNRMDYLVELNEKQDVRSLKPDFRQLQAVDVRGVIVTAHEPNTSYDFVSRFFAPRVGVDEDPVTGSAHCALTPYWAAKLGKTSLSAYQASARGGVLRLRLEGERVVISGQAVTIFTAQLNAPVE